jgi:hypothetical protein
VGCTQVTGPPVGDRCLRRARLASEVDGFEPARTDGGPTHC